MTPEQIDLVEATLAEASPRLEDMASDFYKRLFRQEPQLKSMFTGDRRDQEKKFVAELEAIISTIREHSSFVPAARDLGDRHQGYGVRAAHYRMAGTALLEALAAALGDDWTRDVEEAWRLAYNLTSETMMAGAAGHIPTDAPPTASPTDRPPRTSGS